MSRFYDLDRQYGEGSAAVPVDPGSARGGLRRIFRLVAIGRERIGIVVLIGAAAFGLARVGPRPDGPDAAAERIDLPGSGIIVASEVIRLRIPETLAKLAAAPPRRLAIRSHEDLRRSLERLDQRGLWYAVSVRSIQVDGGRVEMTFVRRPYDEPQHFPELLRILARAGGAAGAEDAIEFSDTAVEVIPDKWARRGPSWPIERLGRPAGTGAGPVRR